MIFFFIAMSFSANYNVAVGTNHFQSNDLSGFFIHSGFYYLKSNILLVLIFLHTAVHEHSHIYANIPNQNKCVHLDLRLSFFSAAVNGQVFGNTVVTE